MGAFGDIDNLRKKLKANRQYSTRRYVFRDFNETLRFEKPKTSAAPHRFQKIIDISKLGMSDPTEDTVSEVPADDKNRSKSILKIIIYIVFLIVIGLLFYVITPLSNVSTVSITGHTHLTTEEVYELSDVEVGSKMYFIDTERVASTLEHSPLIEDAFVTKSGLNSLDIHIAEQHTVAYLSADGFYPVKSNGYMLLEPVNMPLHGPIIYNFDEEGIHNVVDALAILDYEILRTMSEIYARPSEENGGRIQLFMNDGQEVIADISTLSEKISFYTGIRSEIDDSADGLIDLEIGNSFLPYSSQEARELRASIYGESVSRQERDRLDNIIQPLKTELENFSVQ